MDDALSRIASLIDNDGVTHLADYTRLGLGRIVQVAYPQPTLVYSLINGSGSDPYSGLDQFDRVADCRWFNTGTNADVERIQHGHDRASSRLWRKAPVAAAAGVNLDELYLYDGRYRLRDMQRGALSATQTAISAGTENFAQAWGLDATGNWSNFLEDDVGGGTWNLNQSRMHSDFNEITGITGGSWVVPAHDAAGNMVAMPQPSAPTSGYAANFDAWNRLVVLSSGGTTIAANLYDGLMRRTTKVVSGTTRHFYYSARWQVLEERVGSATSYDRQFVWGMRYIDDMVLRDAASYVRLYGLQDPNFNVTALADASGTVQERYRYTAYGQPTVLTGTFSPRGSSTYDWETLFCGERSDPETGLSPYRNRHYHPLLGRFLSRDIIPLDQASNPYQYVSGRAVTFVDTFGRDEVPTVPVNAKCTDRCGPDVTEWYFKDLNEHFGRMDAERKMSNSVAFARSWYKNAKYYMAYKWMTFAAPGCAGGRCKNTVWLAGLCVRKNQLGNIAFGFMANALPGILVPGDTIRTGYALGNTYSAKHPHAANFGRFRGLRRKDNLAAFSLGQLMAGPQGTGPSIVRMSAAQFGATMRLWMAADATFAKYASLYGDGATIAANDFTFIPDFGGFNTGSCKQCTGPDGKASIHSGAGSKASFEDIEKAFAESGADSDLDDWLQETYEDYTK